MVISGVHNHEIAKHIKSHEYPLRLKSIEKQFVVDMTNSIAPCEILNILKQKDPSNTMGIKSIYNALFSNKAVKLDGLTLIQYVISQLLKKDYLHQFLTNLDTNEITDIIWVHPMSLELSVNFSSILIIDLRTRPLSIENHYWRLWASHPHGELTSLYSHILVMRENKH